MKYIVKGGEPTSFVQWKSKNRRANWDVFSQEEHQPVKQELKRNLCREQGNMCCYCEVKIECDIHSHIEHLKPKSQFPKSALKYENLLASCMSKDSCGHKKQGQYFPQMVSPLKPNCQGRFTYTANGKIIPKREDDKYAQKTIDVLGLNSKYLRDRRKSIIKALDSPGMGNDYIIDSLENCCEWYDGFYTLIEYIACKRGVKN